MRFKVHIHQTTAEYWAEVADLPGCFASGRTLNELSEALGEAVGLYLWNEPGRLEPWLAPPKPSRSMRPISAMITGVCCRLTMAGP